MTPKQFELLEEFIKAIIRDNREDADVYDAHELIIARSAFYESIVKEETKSEE